MSGILEWIEIACYPIISNILVDCMIVQHNLILSPGVPLLHSSIYATRGRRG